MNVSSTPPIVVFGYNRPDHLHRTLETLARAEGAARHLLILRCDGPKPGTNPASVEAVREVARDSCWTKAFAEVEIVVAPENLGLARSIVTGVGAALERYDRIIVLEDDLLVAPDFLHFMTDALDFYANDSTVGSVTGFCPLRDIPPSYEHDVMAVPRNCSQGWGIWADRWVQIEWNSDAAAKRVRYDSAKRRRLDIAGSDRSARLERQASGLIDSWSIRFGLWQIETERNTIYPVHNRIRNIGYDGSGVHSGYGIPMNEAIAGTPRPYKLVRVAEDPRILRTFRQVYSGPLHRRLLRHARRWMRGGA